MSTFGESCSRHGDRRHATVHEAGHLLAAIERSVPYEYVVIHEEPVQMDDGEWAAGWVHVDQDRMGAVSIVPGLEFAIAGASAERVLLGDCLPYGSKRDIQEWKRWHELGMEGDLAVLESHLGEAIQDVRTAYASLGRRPRCRHRTSRWPPR